MASNNEQRQVEIIVNGKKANASIKDMEAAVKILNKQLRDLPQGTEEFVKKSEELKTVRDRLKGVKDDVYALDKAGADVSKSAGTSFGSLAGIIAGGLVAAIGMAVTMIINFGKEAFELAKKYSDAFADIRKSTGMTAEEVQGLNDRLGELDTRTTQMELLGIAKVGGQLGIAKDQMDAFVESTDKAVVALGDEFAGGAEEVAKEVGGLNRLFKDTRDLSPAESILKIGSAINELGAAGAANGPFISDFAKRVGGLGPELAPAISQTLGLGAALQELGETSENAASGTKTLITTAAADIPAFAKQIGMGAKEFQNLINSSPNDAILKLAESFKGMLPSDVIMKLNELGIKSKEAQGVMLKLAGNTDFVREKQELASKAIKEGTSLQNEFNIKNNTTAAIAEKNAKAFEKLQVQFGQSLAPVINMVLEFLTGLFNVLTSVYKEVEPLFSAFFDAFRQLAQSLGVATDKGSALAGILEFLGATVRISLIPLKVILTVLTALAGAFSWVYQNVGFFRKAIDIAIAPLKMLWEAIKQVVDWMGKLGSLAGKEVKVKATVQTTTNNTTTKPTDATKPDPSEDAGLLDAAIAEAAEKEKKKEEQAAAARERQKKAAEKHEQDMQKLRDDYQAKLLASEQANEALRESMTEDGLNKKLLKLTNSHNKELAAIEKNRKAILDNEAIAQEQKMVILNQYAEQEQLLNQKFQTEKAVLEEEQRQAAKEKKQQEMQEELELKAAQDEEALLEIEQRFTDAVNAEQALEDAKFEIRRAAAERDLQFLIDSGNATETQIQSAKNKILGIEVDHAKKTADNVKKTEEIKRNTINAGLNVAKDLFAVGIELLGKDKEARKKHATAIKAFGIASILTNLYQEVAGIWKNSTAFGPLGTAIAVVQTAAATIRAYNGVRNVTSQEFADGGFTGHGLGPTDRTGFRIAGVVHENEYVSPKWMVENPRYANVFGYLEAERQRGKGFADGGFTTPVGTPSAANASANAAGSMMQQMIMELQTLRTVVENWPTQLQVVNNVGDTQDKIQLLNQIRSDAGL